MNNRIINKSLGALLALTALSGAALSAPSASADTSASVNVSVTVPSVCSLTASPESVSNTIYPGHDDTIGTTNIKAICNDPAGLAVYAVGYTGNTYGNTNLTATVGASSINISTHVTPSGTPSASEWYMTLTAVSGDYIPTIVTNFDSAHEIPDVYTKVAYRNSVTDMGTNATGANFTAAFDAYIAENQAAGTYTGKVKFLLVHPSTHDAPITPIHQICYYGNGEDEGTMACQTTVDGGSDATITTGSLVTLRAPNFSKSDYGFASWNTKEDSTGTNYGPNETITFTQDMYENNGLILYANWKAPESGVTMQTFNPSATAYNDTNKPIGSVIALRDERDNDVYAVAKLADGRWWMIENLRLDYGATRGSANTTLSQGYGSGFDGLAEPESANFADSTVANSLYTTDTSSTDHIIIQGNNAGRRFPRYNNNNTSSRVANQTSADANIYSYGNYYTWHAAVADTASSPTSGHSICPAGWHIPIGGRKSNFDNSEWWALFRTIVGTNPLNYDNISQPYYRDRDDNTEGTDASRAIRAYPTNFVYSGQFEDSSATRRGSDSYYWTSSGGSDYAFEARVAAHEATPGTGLFSKYYGFAIRCIANQ